ncbi:TonB-dependent receptor [Novosphingobium sp. Gsoil 351]|uniref:TonB-dependent receptor n=1 Tax=Novosphingobium sp. Gsoil 351 TaxID=2675225 RepID=UPI0012B477C8|nr:TonB-dependent receptor [Novosphingobium sp. Gsoil 351]QGN55711.1 TonB-dependent receptor [Novosphingobium sp. Gsoil 351]
MKCSLIFPDRLRHLRLALLAATAMPWAALAEEADPEIIVTARRQDERFADIPLTVNVVTAGAIGSGAVEGLQSLATKVPGLSFENVQGGFSEPVLRGQHQPNPTSDSATALFVDGVYQASRDGKDVEPLDLERIEVVHGPQSALFGHSSFAGLIAYVPARPTEGSFATISGGFGSDRNFDMGGTVSGPIDQLLAGRIALAWRNAGGTWKNTAAPGEHLGGLRSNAISATIATRDGTGPLGLRLSARYGSIRTAQQPQFTLDYRQYNCGARDPASGVWSYFCGVAPIPSQIALSPGIPESTNHTGQVALHLTLELGQIELLSDTSYYEARTTSFRDADGYPGGELFGVCATGVNCSGPASLVLPVLRLQPVDRVGRTGRNTREFVQELRFRSAGPGRLEWQAGAVAFVTRMRSIDAFGAARGSLTPTERLTSLVLANPQRVGALAFVNNALVADPNASQLVQNDAAEHRQTLALFAAADYRLATAVRLRGELRGNWERVALDARLANFRSSFGKTLGPRRFFDLTPRVSIDFRPEPGWLTYASYARGSRSGGINPQPNLVPEEQTFEPESNWTAELGVKYAGHGVLRSAQATGYHIDWRNTQIVGFPVTPGIGSLISHNTKGIETWGIELAGDLAPARWLGLDAAFSYAHARFKPGSEDPGGSAFCGLALGVSTSSFCRIVPSHVLPGQLVPDISGNRPSRSVGTSWTAGLTLEPLAGRRLRVELSHQGNVFDRQIEGLAFGARTLLDARFSFPLGPVATELWGTNLTDRRYIRSAGGGGGRAASFYLGQPRPQDFVLGERRRLGLTVRYPR